jgi:hypothetical protein
MTLFTSIARNLERFRAFCCQNGKKAAEAAQKQTKV